MNIENRLSLAYKSLVGTSIGDAFGESFFGDTQLALQNIERREIPETTWDFTDDTVMTIAVYKNLEKHGRIEQEDLAMEFARLHDLDPNRGYGATARAILREISTGRHWRELSKSVFEGMGSMGNGASMRVAPIGAYFFDDLSAVAENAKKSAEVTHMNQEAIAGAIAVATAAALATQRSLKLTELQSGDFLTEVIKHVPASDVCSKINKARSIPYSYSIETVKAALGDGTKILAQDTVPICLWCAAHTLNNFEAALWKAVSVLGDSDTICAIVASIVILSAELETVPFEWINDVEQIQSSRFYLP